MKEQERSLAKVLDARIGEVYNGMPGLCVTFKYDDGFHQGIGGYLLDASFVIRFLSVFGTPELNQIKGRSCWITHTWNSITKIEPLHKDEGKPFVIAEWKEWVERRMPRLCYSELETGIDPKERP